MIIRMERSGGFTGIPLRSVINSERLDVEEDINLRNMVESAGFFTLPAVIAPQGEGTDRFYYQLTVEDAGRIHTVEVREGAAPESLLALINQVSLLARRARSDRKAL